MQSVNQFVRKYPLTSLLVVVIWVLCLIPVPETPLSDVKMIDKWTHIAMYFVLSMVVAFEQYKNKRQRHRVASLLMYAFLLPALMGGLLEILQATCTGGRRSGEWLDFFADALGSAIAVVLVIIGTLLAARGAKR